MDLFIWASLYGPLYKPLDIPLQSGPSDKPIDSFFVFKSIMNYPYEKILLLPKAKQTNKTIQLP